MQLFPGTTRLGFVKLMSLYGHQIFVIPEFLSRRQRHVHATPSGAGYIEYKPEMISPALFGEQNGFVGHLL